MKIRSIGLTGNSLSAGFFAVNADRALMPQLVRKLRERGHPATEPWVKSVTDGGGMYNVFGFWSNVLRSRELDMLVIQGCLEQEFYTNEAATLSAAVSPTSTALSFLKSGGGAATITSGLYRLYDANNEEWVMAESSGGSASTSYRRGLFGTVARYWPAGTTVEINAATGYSQTDPANFAATLLRYRKLLEQVVMCPKGIVLVGDCWFNASSVVTNAIASLVSELQADYPLIEFVPYVKQDGTRIWADPSCKGPSAVTTAIAYDGAVTPQNLTVTCANDLGVSQLRAGQYIGLWKSSTSEAAPSRANVEIMKISTIDYVNKRFTVAGDTTGNRQLWQSPEITTFTDTETVCALAMACIEPRFGVDNLGAAATAGNAWNGTGYFSNAAFAWDSHPVDQGYDELAEAYMRAFDRVAERC